MDGNSPDGLRNLERTFTKAFRYLGSNLFHIYLHPEGCFAFVFSWFGSVPNYYILHSIEVNGHFQQLSLSDRYKFNLVHNSDKDEESVEEDEANFIEDNDGLGNKDIFDDDVGEESGEYKCL